MNLVKNQTIDMGDLRLVIDKLWNLNGTAMVSFHAERPDGKISANIVPLSVFIGAM